MFSKSKYYRLWHITVRMKIFEKQNYSKFLKIVGVYKVHLYISRDQYKMNFINLTLYPSIPFV